MGPRRGEIVACCRSCNDLFNRDPVIEAIPTTLEAFFDLRDRIYLARRARIVERRSAERVWFEDNVLSLATKAPASIARPLYSRAWLESSGFSGFVSVSSLQGALDQVPLGPGVYAVVREATTPARFLAKSPGGWFKGKDPSAPAEQLQKRWNDETPIVYFGKADSLRPRIRALVRFAAGEPVGTGAAATSGRSRVGKSFLVAWRETEQPRELERDLLSDFAAHFGTLPFANLVG